MSFRPFYTVIPRTDLRSSVASEQRWRIRLAIGGPSLRGYVLLRHYFLIILESRYLRSVLLAPPLAAPAGHPRGQRAVIKHHPSYMSSKVIKTQEDELYGGVCGAAPGRRRK